MANFRSIGGQIGGGYDNIVVGTEQQIGIINIDGTTYTLYRKVIDFGALPNNTLKQKAHGISSCIGVLDVWGMVYETNNNVFLPIPWIAADGSKFESIYITPTLINITNNFDDSNKKAFIFIEYYR